PWSNSPRTARNTAPSIARAASIFGSAISRWPGSGAASLSKRLQIRSNTLPATTPASKPPRTRNGMNISLSIFPAPYCAHRRPGAADVLPVALVAKQKAERGVGFTGRERRGSVARRVGSTYVEFSHSPLTATYTPHHTDTNH